MADAAGSSGGTSAILSDSTPSSSHASTSANTGARSPLVIAMLGQKRRKSLTRDAVCHRQSQAVIVQRLNPLDEAGIFSDIAKTSPVLGRRLKVAAQQLPEQQHGKHVAIDDRVGAERPILIGRRSATAAVGDAQIMPLLDLRLGPVFVRHSAEEGVGMAGAQLEGERISTYALCPVCGRTWVGFHHNVVALVGLQVQGRRRTALPGWNDRQPVGRPRCFLRLRFVGRRCGRWRFTLCRY